MVNRWRALTSSAKQFYFSCSLMVFNTLVVFVALNLFLQMAFFLHDSYVSGRGVKAFKNALKLSKPISPFNPDGSPVDNGKRNSYQLAWIDYHAYENLSPSFVSSVLDEAYDLAQQGMTYQPWVEFAEPEFHGKYVSVERDELGFLNRRTLNPSNEDEWPTVRIFALGGSTTFGYNVADEHTWPTYLSAILNKRARDKSLHLHVEVKNYGRGYYYPSQETTLLIDLLKAGHRPQIVIFLDGVNSPGADDVPHFYPQLQAQFHNVQFAQKVEEKASILETVRWLPLLRLVDSIGVFFSRPPQTVAERESASDPKLLQYKLNMFRQNRDLATKVGQLYSVQPLFFLQPSAVHSYNPGLYRRPVPPEFNSWRARSEEFYTAIRKDAGLIYLGDLFEKWDKSRKAIVDELHYSPSFHEFLAEEIAKNIDLAMLKPDRPALEISAATGSRVEH